VIRKLLVIIIFTGLYQLANAQSQADCSESLNRARDEFNAGHLEAVPNILHDCIKNGFSKAQKVDAYRILTITYLYLDDPIGAENSFLALLAVEPQFQVAESDPVELEYLSKQFITNPITSYFIKAGANFSTATVLFSNPIGRDTDPVNYRIGAGFNFMGGMDLHFNEIVSLTMELELSSRALVKEFVPFAQVEPQKGREVLTAVHGSIPVSVKFTYPGIKFLPYVYGGYSPSFTILTRSNNTRDPVNSEELVNNGLKLNSQTPAFSHSLIFGAGLKARVGKRFGYKYAILDFRYRSGMTNMNNEASQYDFSNPDNKWRILRQLNNPDDFRWNGFEVAIGFVWPIYKPRAKNSVTIQTVIKGWFRKKEKGNE
jgi:outer membrane protein with beta-barrel domain